ncbi:C2 domain-containing protein, putative [Phytophthora infestans T30-4]|uniref:C2 domain-containing protein, putative n=1 Tax=Phytophthora infestans (strain T30-4) TaxID=403677 RepID=D0NHE2_PHYIT|nr:C2 domain-containing protein, putative [Phytophthora infestans T30-4]EEY58867.1 C2 domain-containing protein, putative [Phytophthora infestans T30-4]|eukprot:XP_002901340.1 C2 domain-containing protein, putative [Phytophthora infestans T30-4]
MGQAPSGAKSGRPALTHSTPTLFPLPSDESDLPDNAVLDVELEIVSAKDIIAGDYLGVTALLKGQLSSSDAYAVIEVDGHKVAWTHPVFSTLEPVWNEKFFFKNVRPDSLCKLYLFDKDVNTDDELGETQFTAANTDGTVSTFELAIYLHGRSAGTIVVKYGPVRYSVHSSVTAGLMTMSTSNEARIESLAYHIQLHNIHQFLPTEHEWNKDYPTIQRIFSPDYPGSPVLRQAIMTQHAVIYTHGPMNTKYGAISSPREFFKLIHDGRRQDKAVLFTYVITKNGWYFSETGAAFFKDMLSKHMLHSGAAFSVLYAGESRVDNYLFGEPKLVIDNDSGTYAPPKEDLPQLKALMEDNFPGMTVEALNRENEEQQKTRKEILGSWM